MDSLDDNESANLHSAGATVIHNSPFHNLPSHRNQVPLTSAFIQKWAVPFYMEIGKLHSPEWPEQVRQIKPEITREVCLVLLGDFNWRTRLVGAYFAAVKRYEELIDIIGTHLLKSELCCVGHIYALILAFFNNEQSIGYLLRFLDHYLTRQGPHGDQAYVLQALLYLDKVNNTRRVEKLLPAWTAYLEQGVLQHREITLELIKIHEAKNESGIVEALKQMASKALGEASPLSTRYFDEQIPLLSELAQYPG